MTFGLAYDKAPAVTSRGTAGALLPLVLACSTAAPPRGSDPRPPAAKTADLVLISGRIVRPRTTLPEATALAVRAGRIVAIGADADVAPYVGPRTELLELAGATVIPGLHDAHVHLLRLGQTEAAVNLVGTASVQEIQQRVARAVARAAPGAWVTGRGWDRLPGDDGAGEASPTARDLDGVAPNQPVVLTRADERAIWVNRVALRRAGITAETPDPPGGRIERQGGQPTGILVGRAADLVLERIPRPSKAALAQAFLLAQAECLSAGLVAVHDMGVDAYALSVLKELDAEGRLELRIFAYLDGAVEDLTPLIAAGPAVPSAESSRRLTVRGVNFHMDGTLGARGAALFAPYDDAPLHRGRLLIDPAVFEARVRTVVKHGFSPAAHAVGDRANRLALDVYERVIGRDTGTVRPRIEHAQVIHPDDLDRFAELGVVASIQPTHATRDMPWAERRVGRDRIDGAYAWQSLLTSGATLAAGSDAPVEDISPVRGLYAAITRKDLFGLPEEGWRWDERMHPRQALHAFTAGAAYAAFVDHDVGRLEVGRIADLTVLDHSPLDAREEELVSARVRYTIVAGRVAYAGADAR